MGRKNSKVNYELYPFEILKRYKNEKNVEIGLVVSLELTLNK